MPERTLTTPQSGTDERTNQDPAKPAFEEPRLAFIKPKLTPLGDLRDLTANGGPGFFGSFDPNNQNY